MSKDECYDDEDENYNVVDECYSDEDDDYGLLKQAFEVVLPKNFNPNKIPQTGEEYLQHVVYERNQCKTWLSVDIDRTKYKNNQTFKVELDNIVKSPQTHLPTLEWQNEKIEDFKKFRQTLQLKQKLLPDTTVVDEKFIKEMIFEAPKFSQLSKYTQSAKIRMLEMITKHLEEISGIEDNLGSWLYGIFAMLEIPLSPSSCFTLREFCKKCIKLRSKLPENDEKLCKPFNLFICIVAKYFNQLDLGD